MYGCSGSKLSKLQGVLRVQESLLVQSLGLQSWLGTKTNNCKFGAAHWIYLSHPCFGYWTRALNTSLNRA